MFDPRLCLTQLESAIPTSVIDQWNTEAQLLDPSVGRVGADTVGREDLETRASEIRWITPRKQLQLYTRISNTILDIVDAEMHNFRVDIFRTLDLQYTTYYVNNFYTRHVDMNIASARNDKQSINRKLTMVVMMSDGNEYVGGDLIVGNKTISRKKGTMCIFFPFIPHEVKLVTEGVRRSLVMWANGPEWR